MLISNDKNIEEGMQLIKKALDISPDNYFYLWIQGLGYYKQGKYEEAISNLNLARDSIIGWNHDINKQLQEAKKALASQN
jgi:tetratricopeptide (TPR) repeat protein